MYNLLNQNDSLFSVASFLTADQCLRLINKYIWVLTGRDFPNLKVKIMYKLLCSDLSD